MVLPVVAYGASVLRKKCNSVGKDYKDLQILVGNMWETLQSARGCGLAAPQVNVPVRIFIVDSVSTYNNMDAAERVEYFDGDSGIKEVFINAEIIGSSKNNVWDDEEGCLSIPGLAEIVQRPWQIKIKYFDEGFNEHIKDFSGITARMIQHEYDHIEGKLYLDYLNPLKKAMLANKLEKIRKGKIKPAYQMKYL